MSKSMSSEAVRKYPVSYLLLASPEAPLASSWGTAEVSPGRLPGVNIERAVGCGELAYLMRNRTNQTT